MIRFENEFNAITLIKVFEPQVIDKKTGEIDYIIFDVSIQGTKFVAQHVAMSTKQEKSKKIAFCSVKIDPDFSIDCNLQELYEECDNAICESEFFGYPAETV